MLRKQLNVVKMNPERLMQVLMLRVLILKSTGQSQAEAVLAIAFSADGLMVDLLRQMAIQ
jgi:hypothetical protein